MQKAFLLKKCSLFFLFLLLGLTGFGQQNSVTISACTGKLSECLTSNDTISKLCVKVTIPAGHCAVKSYKVDWGDGAFQTFTPSGKIETEHEHSYNVGDIVKRCVSEKKFLVEVTTVNEATCAEKEDNNSFKYTFKSYPRPQFTTTSVCQNQTIYFNEFTCPSEAGTTYKWDYGDGTTGTQGSHIYPKNGDYTVTLNATNSCGVSPTPFTKVIKVIEPAKAALKKTGLTVAGKDSILCLSQGGVLSFDGSGSSNATEYYWQISGGNGYGYVGSTNYYSDKPQIKFTAAGTYTVELTVNNACRIASTVRYTFTVSDLPVLKLTPQADNCEALKYKISNPVAGATYTLDGKPLAATDEIQLDLRAAPYIVTATLSNLCGTQKVADTFYVDKPNAVKITSLKDTAVCVGAGLLLLETNIKGGSWTGAAVEQNAGKTYFNPKTKGKFVLKYQNGTGKCATADSVKIAVEGVEAVAQDVGVCQGASAVKLIGSPAGGKWTTSDCQGCIKGDTLNLNGLTINKINVTYEVTGGASCKASSKAVVSVGRPKADFQIADGCSGSVAKIINQSLNASTYQWFVNGILKSSVQNPQLDLPSGKQTIKLLALAGQCSDSLTKTVTITAAPSPISFSVNVQSGCSPLVVAYVVAGSERPDVNYNWTFGDSTSSTTFQPKNHIFKNQTKKDLVFRTTLKTKNICGEQTYFQDVTVKPLAQAEIGIDSTTFRCTPARIKFSNRSAGYDKNSSVWSFGDGTTLTTPNDTLSHWFAAKDSARTYKIQLTVNSQCGRDTASVSIKIFPTLVKALFTMSQSEICPNEPIQFKDATTPKPERWLWKFSDGGIETQANPSHVFTKPNSVFGVMLIAYTTCGYDSTKKTVKTTQLPEGNFTFSQPYFCQNQAVKIINTSNPQYRYKWSFGDGSPIDSVNYSPTHIYKAASGSQTVVLTLLGGTFNSCKTSISKSVMLRPQPKADFAIVGPAEVCYPNPIRLENKSQNANQYVWKYGNGLQSTLENPEIVVKTGEYDLTLLATFDGVCRDSVTKTNVFKVDSCQVYIPDVFTPNNDGVGDVFTVFGGKGLESVNYLKIRNRWGELVFVTENSKPNDTSLGWNGTVSGQSAPTGLYTYETEVLFIDKHIERKVGTFNLIR